MGVRAGWWKYRIVYEWALSIYLFTASRLKLSDGDVNQPTQSQAGKAGE